MAFRARTRDQISNQMRRIRKVDTKPELIVRRIAHRLGYRFRLHRRDLPGTPDLTFPSKRKVVLVHGCFWHRHRNCKKSTTPKSNAEFWQAKFAANKRRDRVKTSELRSKGFSVLVVWECETLRPSRLRSKLSKFLGLEVN